MTRPDGWPGMSTTSLDAKAAPAHGTGTSMARTGTLVRNRRMADPMGNLSKAGAGGAAPARLSPRVEQTLQQKGSANQALRPFPLGGEVAPFAPHPCPSPARRGVRSAGDTRGDAYRIN